MPEIAGHFPIEPDLARMQPCVLCLEPTDVLALAPGLDPPTDLPLHVLCAGWLVVQYGRLRSGRIAGRDFATLTAYAERVAGLLASGGRREG